MNNHISTTGQYCKQESSSTGQGKTFGNFTQACFTKTENNGGVYQQPDIPLLSTVAAVGLGSLRDTASGREWRRLAWASNLLFAPDFPARMRRSRRKRLKHGPLLPALISSFELKLCKSSPSTNSFPVGMLWSLVHTFTVV